jgi:adiponectin receptor
MISQQIFFYISVIVLLLSTIAAVLFVASPGIRTSSFLLYVLFANGVPYIYQLVLTAADLEQHNVPKEYLVLWTLMWCLMLVGLLVKSAMIPERWFPGRFDVLFASHQWWHLFVNAGAAMAYFTWKSYLLWRPTVPCDPEAGLPD